jgi:hypothetical protein
MQPSPHWTTETTRDDAGWIVTARWWGEKGEPASDGPREVVIRLADNASPDVRQRGVNSGVMRRLEHHVNDMAAEVHDMPSVGAYAVMARRYVEDRLAQLPAGPREGGDVYYRGLLELFEDVTAKGHPEPVNLLSTVMGIPKDTLKTRLRTARQRRGTTQAPPK